MKNDSPFLIISDEIKNEEFTSDDEIYEGFVQNNIRGEIKDYDDMSSETKTKCDCPNCTSLNNIERVVLRKCITKLHLGCTRTDDNPFLISLFNFSYELLAKFSSIFRFFHGISDKEESLIIDFESLTSKIRLDDNKKELINTKEYQSILSLFNNPNIDDSDIYDLCE